MSPSKTISRASTPATPARENAGCRVVVLLRGMPRGLVMNNGWNRQGCRDGHRHAGDGGGGDVDRIGGLILLDCGLLMWIGPDLSKGTLIRELLAMVLRNEPFLGLGAGGLRDGHDPAMEAVPCSSMWPDANGEPSAELTGALAEIETLFAVCLYPPTAPNPFSLVESDK